jgi:predicted nucleotidyltransferase
MDLKESLEFIRHTIRKYLPEKDYEVFIYGSRADGTAEKWSDVDVGIWGKEKIPSKKLALIKDEVEESNIPYLVDIVDFTRVADKFKRVALSKIIRL